METREHKPNNQPRAQADSGAGCTLTSKPGLPGYLALSTLVLLLLTIHVGLLLYSACWDFVTYDEAANVAAGVYYWETGDYRLYSVNPPLTKLLAALPVLAASPVIPPINVPDVPGRRVEWDVGDKFARANASSYQKLIVLARLAGIGWSVVGGLIVYRWADRLFGSPCGLIGLAVWCIEPNVLTHAHLATADLPAAVAAVTASYTFWCYLNRQSWGDAWVAGMALGVAQLVKTTLIVLYPLWTALWVIAQFCPRPGRDRPSLQARTTQFGTTFLVSLCVLNLGYEFANTGRRLKDFDFVSRPLAGLKPEDELHQGGSAGNRFRGSWLGEIPILLPADYVAGIDLQRRGIEGYEGQPNFLRGEWRVGGWWYYYLYACAVKVPLGILGLFGCALVILLVKRQTLQSRFGLLLVCAVPVVVFFLVSSQTSLNKHLRYVLPAFPFVAVVIGAVGKLIRTTWVWPKVLLLGQLLWATTSSLSVYPCSVSYFNELGGGAENGHWHLSGTNVDIGQDLWRLKEWLDSHPDTHPLCLAYHNHVDPRIAGLKFSLPPVGLTREQVPDDLEQQVRLGPQPGRFAVSVRYVQGQRGNPPDGKGGYRQQVPPNGYTYFQHFKPTARAGYAIFIYDISLAEANRVRRIYGLKELRDAPADDP